MPFFSKIYSLKTVLYNALTSSIGVVTVTAEENSVTVNCSVNKLTALVDGEYYLSVFDTSGKILATKPLGKFFVKGAITFKCDSAFSGVIVTLTDGNQVIATTDVGFIKNIEQYDDEKIAEENYYLREDFYERKTDCDVDASLKENTASGEKEEISKTSASKDGDVVFGGRQVPFYLKDCGKVLHHRLAPKLTTCVPNSTFYLMNEEKEWYFGTVKNDGKVEFVCYAVRANTLKSSALVEYADFVPASLFCSTDGYYITYRDAVTGEVLKKQK